MLTNSGIASANLQTIWNRCASSVHSDTSKLRLKGIWESRIADYVFVGHPYRDALDASYGEDLRVCLLENLDQIALPDRGRRAVVMLA